MSVTAAVPPPLESRSRDKRQRLHQELLSDSSLLLKNRLEVRHLMTRELVIVPPSMPLDKMSELMQERRVHHLLVCGRGDELLGVVSDRDLHGQPGTTAQQVMSHPVLTVSHDMPLSSAISYLVNESVSCLPVVENGRLRGILTTTDLVLALQCTLQLWQRLGQVLQHDMTWSRELEKIAASLDGDLSAAELASRITEARQAIRHQVQDLVNSVDLRADVYTGMSNRQGLEDMLALLLAVKNRYDQTFSLAIVQIDYFDRIADACGEAVVKPLARAVARLIERSVRESDFVARCRTDAFAIVMTNTGPEGAEAFCQRLREAAREHADFDVDIRISTGAVEPRPDEGAAALLARAEAAVE
jgi:diguanylate cyclase (GGDEF)-like protein